MPRIIVPTLASWLICSCSAVDSTYLLRGYDALNPAAARRLAVVAWAPAEHAALAPLLATLTRDRLNTRSSYLVYSAAPMERSWTAACAERVEAVVIVRARRVVLTAEKVDLELETELYRCSDGALLWRAIGSDDAQANEEDLAQMTQSYIRQLGPEVGRYAAAAFLVLADLLSTLPDVSLTDAEVEERLELG